MGLPRCSFYHYCHFHAGFLHFHPCQKYQPSPIIRAFPYPTDVEQKRNLPLHTQQSLTTRNQKHYLSTKYRKNSQK